MLVLQSLVMKGYNIILVLFSISTASAVDHFNESLTIKPLVSGHVSAQFDFIINAEKVAGPHYELVPRQLGEVLSAHSVRELHLSLTQGFWRHSVWGYPPREAGTGARLWVWFHSNTQDVDAAWSSLVSALSGLFCASLNFMDGTVTASPELAYRPAGVVRDAGELDSRLLRVASLPREATCTENLTPWQKLLPCAAMAGMSSLLNPLHLYSSSYHSLSVDFRPVCKSEPCAQPSQELAFSVAVVHDPAASGQQRRPDPTQYWSLKSLFGAGLFGACALAQHSNVYVDLSTNQTHPFSLTPPPETTLTSRLAGHEVQYSVYSTGQLTAAGGANLRSRYLRGHRPGWVPPLPLTATQYQTGSGQFAVGLSLQLRNSDRRAPLEVTVLQVVPWYVRLLLHTLRVTSASGAELQPVTGLVVWQCAGRLVPGRDRRRPHLLELAVRVPAASVATVHVQARRAFLKWHEYPPDANHGFYLPGAVVSALLPPANLTRHPHRRPPEQGGRVFVSLSTENLLVTLPTPDFSMPYNVICLVCTVVALAFGPLHNICTKHDLTPLARVTAAAKLAQSRGDSQAAASAAPEPGASPQLRRSDAADHAPVSGCTTPAAEQGATSEAAGVSSGLSAEIAVLGLKGRLSRRMVAPLSELDHNAPEVSRRGPKARASRRAPSLLGPVAPASPLPAALGEDLIQFDSPRRSSRRLAAAAPAH